MRLRTATAVRTGRLIELASLSDTIAEIGLRQGADLDADPEDNFSGQEPFAVIPVEGADGYLYGSIDGGTLTAGPGHAPVQLAFDREVPVTTLSVLHAHVTATITESGLVDGILGFAVTQTLADEQILPAFTAGVQATIARDCTSPTDPYCPPDTEGERVLIYFDDDGDGTVTLSEIRQNALISPTINSPDLDLLDADGVPSPEGDGVNDSLSFAVGFTAVGAVVAE